VSALPVAFGAEELKVEGRSGFVPNYVLRSVVSEGFAKAEETVVIHPEDGLHHCI
jgi:hypothetical protein